MRAGRHIRTLALVLLAGLVAVGCVYYNTFFNAKKKFDVAAKQSPATPGASGQARMGAGYRGYQEAIERFSRVIERYPKSKWVDDAWYYIGVGYYCQGEYNKSERAFREILEKHPKSKYMEEATFWLAACLVRSGEPFAGREQMRKLAHEGRKKKWRAAAWHELGQLFFEDKEYDSAAAAFLTVAEEYSAEESAVESRFKAGEAFRLAGQEDRALEQFHLAMRKNPTPELAYRTHVQMADAYLGRGQVDSTLALLQALAGDDLYVDSLGVLQLKIGQAFEQDGRFDEAFETYKNVSEKFPKTAWAAEALFRTGYIHQTQRFDFASAREYYQKAKDEYARSEFAQRAVALSVTLATIEGYRAEIAKTDSAAADSTAPPDSGAVMPPDSAAAADTSMVDSLPGKPGFPAGPDTAETADSAKPTGAFDPRVLLRPVGNRWSAAPSDTAVGDSLSRSGGMSEISSLADSTDSTSPAPVADPDGSNPHPEIGDSLTPPDPGLLADTAQAADTPHSADSTSAVVNQPLEPALRGLDTTLILDTTLVVDTTLVIDSAMAIDTVRANEAIQAGDTAGAADTTLTLDTVRAPDTALAIDTAGAADTILAINAGGADDTALVADTTWVFDTTFVVDSSLVFDTILVFDTVAVLEVRRAAEAEAAAYKKRKEELEKLAGAYFKLAEAYHTVLDVPDSALFYYDELIRQFPESEQVPRALFAGAALLEEHFHDSTAAAARYRRVLDNYGRTDYAGAAIERLGLAGTPADTGYPGAMYREAEHALIEANLPESARVLFGQIVREFPGSVYAPQAAYASVVVTEQSHTGEDSTLYFLYQRIIDSFPGTPYAVAAKARIGAGTTERRQKPRVVLPSAPQEEKVDSTLAALKAEQADTFSIRSPRAPRPQNAGVCKYPDSERDSDPWRGAVVFKIFIDLTGRIDQYEMVEPSNRPDIDANATAAVEETYFNPDSIPPESLNMWYLYDVKVNPPAARPENLFNDPLQNNP